MPRRVKGGKAPPGQATAWNGYDQAVAVDGVRMPVVPAVSVP
jgi:hypothetical protein